MKIENILAVHQDAPLPYSDLAQLTLHTVIAQREWLETNKDFRQLLPYVTIGRINADGDVEYLLYRRVKGSGEGRLLGGYSIGFGGHIDLEDVKLGLSNTVNVVDTVIESITRELNEETTLDVEDIQKLRTHIHTTGMVDDFIKLDLNDTDMVHLGLAFSLMVKGDVDCPEQSMEKIGWFKIDDIEKQCLAKPLENWSKYIVDSIIKKRQVS